jgi:hypothetical protein
MLVKKVFESKLPSEKCIFQYFKLKLKFLSSSVAEPKLFISAPAPAPTFKKFRFWLRLQVCNYLFAQLLN